MAAAADVPGATKGLLLLFALCTVVHVTHSLEAEQHLEILTKYYQGGLFEAAKKKAELDDGLASFVEDFQEVVDKISLVIKRLEVITQNNYYLRELPAIVNGLLDEKTEEAKNDIQAYEKEMQDIWAFINRKENDHDEL